MRVHEFDKLNDGDWVVVGDAFYRIKSKSSRMCAVLEYPIVMDGPTSITGTIKWLGGGESDCSIMKPIGKELKAFVAYLNL